MVTENKMESERVMCRQMEEEAQDYIKLHKIPELFKNMTALLLYHQPGNNNVSMLPGKSQRIIGQYCILAHFILPDRSRPSTVWQLVVRYTRSGCLLVPGTQPLTLIQRKTEITIAGTNHNPEP